MMTMKFEQLCASLCGAAGAAGGHAREVRVDVNDVAVLIRPDDAPAPTRVRLCVSFGPLPEEKPLSACQALMEVNSLMLWSADCSFARDPATGEIVLQYSYPLEGASASELYATVLELAEVARSWREHWFLCPSGLSPVASLIEAAQQMN